LSRLHAVLFAALAAWVGAAHAEDNPPDENGLVRPAKSEQYSPPMMHGMDMDDTGPLHRVWLENLEAVSGNHNGESWDGQAWAGGDFNKLWLKSEGDYLNGRPEEARVEAFWAHAVLPFWDTQVGMREDVGSGPSRTWAAVGVTGMAPYWVDTEVTLYVGESGRTGVRVKSEYDLHLTQRWVLRPEVKFNAYGKPDRARLVGAGLADGQVELRLRYEISRRFAPYAGFVYARKFAGTAELERERGSPAVDHRAVAGFMLFF
jgi:copper resistance protein B